VLQLCWERLSLCCNPLSRVLVQLLIAFGAVQNAVSGVRELLSLFADELELPQTDRQTHLVLMHEAVLCRTDL